MENRHHPDWIFILGLPVFIIFLTILGWWWRPSYPQANPEQSSPALRADENSSIVWKQVPIALPDSEIVDTGDPDWLWFKSYEHGFQIKFPREWEYIDSSKSSDGEYYLGFSNFPEDDLVKVTIRNNDKLNLSETNDFINSETVMLGNERFEKITIFNKASATSYFSFKIKKGDKFFYINGDNDKAAAEIKGSVLSFSFLN